MRRSPCLVLATAISTLGGCADAGPAPISMGRVATVEWEGGIPMLYLQDADGSGRMRVHFDQVTDHIAGNYPPDVLPVTDSTVLSIRRVKWSPDGRHLLAIISLTHEQDAVLLLSADGRDLRIVSPNVQIIWSDVEWSPDSRRIAYVMGTGYLGSLPDLFTTDLDLDLVTQVTTSGRWASPTLRFDASGTRLYFFEPTGGAEDGVNHRSRPAYADLRTRSVVEWGDTVTGDPQALARDGSWGLFIRVSLTGPTQLLKRSLQDATESVLATGDIGSAVLLEGDHEALTTWWASDGTPPVFRLIGLARPNDVHATLTATDGTRWASFLPAAAQGMVGGSPVWNPAGPAVTFAAVRGR